jgi:hypothetical protein
MVYVHNADGGYAYPGDKEDGDNDYKVTGDAKLWQFFVPHNDDGGEWAYIMQDVPLSYKPRVYIDHQRIVTKVRENNIIVTLRLINQGSQSLSGDIMIKIKKDGVTALDMGSLAFSIASSDTAYYTLEKAWSNPELWGYGQYGSSVLYFSETTLNVNNSVADKSIERFGFREVWLEGDNMMLNGKKAVVLLYHFKGDHPNAWIGSRDYTLAHIQGAQYAHYNCMHHHSDVSARSWYELADETGMMIDDMVQCCRAGSGIRSSELAPDFIPVLRKFLVNAYTRYVEQHINHPSIVIWVPWDAYPYHPEVTDIMDSTVRLTDSTRLHRYLDNLKFSPEGTATFQDASASYLGPSARHAVGGRIHNRYSTTFNGLSSPTSIFYPSQSGIDQRPYPSGTTNIRMLNWCNPGKKYEETIYDDVRLEIEKYGVTEPSANTADKRSPELIVTARNKPSAIVTVYPLEGQSAQAYSMMTDDSGKAWFVLKEDGKYGIKCQGPGYKGDTSFTASFTQLANLGGYDHIQQVIIGDFQSVATGHTGFKVPEMRVNVFPNPFSTSVEIRVPFWIADCGLRIENVGIYDIKGRLVQIIQNSKSKIQNSYTWDASNQPAGVYFVKVKAGEKIFNKKILLLK